MTLRAVITPNAESELRSACRATPQEEVRRGAEALYTGTLTNFADGKDRQRHRLASG